MSKKYIAVSDDRAKELEDHLKDTFFRDVETFITNYNSGVFNKSAAPVKEIADRIVNTYQNISQPKVGVLAVMSSREVMVSNIIEKLEPWSTITKLKRAIEDKIANGSLTNDDLIVFEEENRTPGILRGIETQSDEDGNDIDVPVIEKMKEERFVIDDKVIEALSEALGKEIEFSEEIGAFGMKASDIVNIDDSFVENVHAALNQ